MIRLRDARQNELQSLTELCLRSKAVWGYDAAFMAACRIELTLRPDDLRSTYLQVAESGTAAVGVAQVKVVSADADLLKLFVEPDQLKSGIGRLLFGWVADQARRAGALRIIIEADPDAVPFYQHMGARRAGSSLSGSIPGRMLPRLILDL
jgi:GNAT superfamily N-acetyltransferase